MLFRSIKRLGHQCTQQLFEARSQIEISDSERHFFVGCSCSNLFDNMAQVLIILSQSLAGREKESYWLAWQPCLSTSILSIRASIEANAAISLVLTYGSIWARGTELYECITQFPLISLPRFTSHSLSLSVSLGESCQSAEAVPFPLLYKWRTVLAQRAV